MTNVWDGGKKCISFSLEQDVQTAHSKSFSGDKIKNIHSFFVLKFRKRAKWEENDKKRPKADSTIEYIYIMMRSVKTVHVCAVWL